MFGPLLEVLSDAMVKCGWGSCYVRQTGGGEDGKKERRKERDGGQLQWKAPSIHALIV
jgi:hypothetical protein